MDSNTLTMLERIQRLAGEKARMIENCPPVREEQGTEEVLQRRYPFDRDLAKYMRKLPDLEQALRPGIAVLDIGAGKAVAATQLQALYGCDVTATGLQAPEGVKIPFVEAVAAELPFPDASFDLVLSVQAISWEANQRKALEEVARVLRLQGLGLLFFTTFSYSVEHRFGEAFWQELGIDPAVYRSQYEIHPAMTIDNGTLTITPVPMKYPYREHRTAYYVKLRKS